MVAAGYDLEDVLDHWTPAMLVRLAGVSSQRRRAEWVMLSKVYAAGAAAGFTGRSGPIESLARDLDVPFRPARAGRPGLGDLVSRLFSRSGGAHAGDHGRAARGRPRGPQR